MTGSHETTAAAPRNSANWSAPAPTLRPTLRPKRQEMNDWDSTIRATFADTQALDLHRQRLLRYARISSLPMLPFRIDTLHYTVLPRLLKSPLAWLVLVFYTVSAALARTGVWEVSYDPNALSGSGMLVSFMIVFYVGYCYNRHFQQYEVCTAAQGAVVSCCLLARANLPHAEDRQLLWSCLNLAHAAGYCGLTPTCTSAPFNQPPLNCSDGSLAFHASSVRIAQVQRRQPVF